MRIFTYNKYIHVWISIILFIACLLFPAIYYGNENQQQEYYHSLFLLLFGWSGILIGYDDSWLANVFYLIGLITFKDTILSLFFGLLMLIFALSVLAHEKIIDPYYWSLTPITKYGLGYYLWVASFTVFCLGQSLLLLNQSRK